MIHGSMDENTAIETLISGLNPQQRAAVVHGRGPLLIVAGAGTGKTATLVHRVAWLIARDTPAERIMLLTFTRRAAAEMLRRADGVLRLLDAGAGGPKSGRVWGGTFHAIATRVLRRYGKAIGLREGFSIHDRADSEDLMNVVRTGLGLAKNDRRFPKKATCMAIYSRCVNSRGRLEDVLPAHFPWCGEWDK
ncbi:MAG: UvrD-helicase domain-containing protein [Planctomycetia bacterium]|nr:UvrD-helicase domain-containing protein [Planctomycetia bacterium]